MIKIIDIKDLSISIEDRTLIKNLNLSIHSGDKIAIIGEEGNGKSTLLKSIYNRELINYATINGTITITGNIGYLEQFLDSKWDEMTIMEYFLKDNPSDEIDYSRYNEINTIVSNLIKVKLNSDIIDSDQLIKTLSGGEKVKLQLAKILCSNPDILLLDEPTNDLDLNTLMWLEEFINFTNIPIIFISHDETLLERTANGILHMEQIKKKQESRFTFERIDYKSYVEKRLHNLSRQEEIAKKQRSEYNKQMEGFRQVYQKVEHQQNTITRADPHGAKLLKKKMKSLKSQEKRYEREKENFEEIPDIEEAINLSFGEVYIPNGKVILDFRQETLKNDTKVLSKNIELFVTGSEHIVIVGNNGVGKTTLFKKIYETLKIRDDIKVGYMPQNYDSVMNGEESVMEFLIHDASKEEITKARTYLGSMKFTKEEATGKIKNLSGGQKAKLFLIKLILDNCNVLLLDEPTRNLSPLSNPVIREVLSKFKGTIISISHDRKYIEEVSDKCYELTSEGLHRMYDFECYNSLKLRI